MEMENNMRRNRRKNKEPPQSKGKCLPGVVCVCAFFSPGMTDLFFNTQS